MARPMAIARDTVPPIAIFRSTSPRTGQRTVTVPPPTTAKARAICSADLKVSVWMTSARFPHTSQSAMGASGMPCSV